MVFSKGHFSDPNCVHLQAGSGATSTVFEIQNNQCGMTSSGGFQSDNGQPNPAGSFIESTIIVQYDPLVQEVFDQARKLRCTWYDYYEKSVTFRPFQVRFVLLEYGLYTNGPFLKLAAPNSRKIQISRGFLAA